MTQSEKAHPRGSGDSPLTLKYAFSSDPNPIRASVDQANPNLINLQVIVSNPSLDPVPMLSITIDIPMGEDSQRALSANPNLPQPIYDDTTGWTISTSGETITLNPPNSQVADAVVFSLEGITVNDSFGVVPITITEDRPPKVSDSESCYLVKLKADFPITNFYADAQTLYDLEQTTTLFWECSDQGLEYVYSVHSDSWQPKDCLNRDDCYTCTDGTNGVATPQLDQTTVFALDVIQAGSIHETLYTTVNVITPYFSQTASAQQSGSGRHVTMHWLAFNASHCKVLLDGKVIDDDAPTNTYHPDQGYKTYVTSEPGPHQLAVIACARRGKAQSPLSLPDISISPPAAIGLEGFPEDIVITPDGTLALVLCVQSNLGGHLAVIDVATMTAEPNRIGVGQMPSAVAITPDGKLALVSSGMDSNIAVVDIPNRRVENTIPVGELPDAIAITPDGGLALVAIYATNSVMVIDVSNFKVENEVINLDGQPWSIAITPDGTLALVVNYTSDDLTVIDIASRQAESKPIPVGKDPTHVAITPDGALALVTNSGDNTVTVIDIAARAVEPKTIAVGIWPYEVTITPDGSQAFVANGTDNTVTVIDIQGRIALSPAIAVGQEPKGIALTPDGEFAFVANQNSSNVVVI